MLRSQLTRGKWDREDYLVRTILNACAMQTDVYSITYKSGTSLLAPISAVSREPVSAPSLLPASLTSVPATAVVQAPAQMPGMMYMAAHEQPEYFRGCVYIRDRHCVLVPDGSLLKPDQFRAMYSGYTFAMDNANNKNTKSAWEAFIESQAFKFPKANRHVFRPELPPLKIFSEEGETVVNSYVPVDTPRRIGDPSPFLELLAKLLPDVRDREILLSYMAACVQYKGIKFQWCPILQGCEGNGKTTMARCVAFALGYRYSHFPNVTDVANKFNAWLAEKLFIGLEEVYTRDKQELLTTLYPMITNDVMEFQRKGGEKERGDNRANFFLTTNHEDAIQVTADTRRWCMFYTAQQCRADKERWGMGGSYFPHLYRWLKNGGYEIVNDLLHTYEIQEEFNPAGACVEAPPTSAFQSVTSKTAGSIEQEILEAIAMGAQGFRGNWISSIALDRFLRERHLARFVPVTKRRRLLQSIGYDFHPVLAEAKGRINTPILAEDNSRPVLYCNVEQVPYAQDPFDARTKYMHAQGYENSSLVYPIGAHP